MDAYNKQTTKVRQDWLNLSLKKHSKPGFHSKNLKGRAMLQGRNLCSRAEPDAHSSATHPEFLE
jgi:hypothetical protein